MTLETSPTTAKLDEALAKAQGEFQGASKEAVNPHFKSRYADLAAVWEVIRAPLSKHGLAITQWPCHSDDGRLHLVTRLAHSGEWMQSTYSSPVGAQTPQAMGSAITYAKRYCLMSVLGIPSEDDDGNSAQSGFDQPQSNRSAPMPPRMPKAPSQQHSPSGQSMTPKPVTLAPPIEKAPDATPELNKLIQRAMEGGPIGARNYAEAIGWPNGKPYPNCMTFQLSIGKNKGKMLLDIDEKDLRNLAEYFIREHRDGKTLSPAAVDTVGAIQDYIDSRMTSPPLPSEHDMPQFSDDLPSGIQS
jgi:hypothetical protein